MKLFIKLIWRLVNFINFYEIRQNTSEFPYLKETENVEFHVHIIHKPPRAQERWLRASSTIQYRVNNLKK